ncbi:CRISPR-associated protein Cas5 [Escherichia coli]|nr:CRISPR-associated protein Cas5 [Escherichia coli]
MRSYLILRLAGPMQAWGQPTFEGTRPTGRFPTRSGLLGYSGLVLGSNVMILLHYRRYQRVCNLQCAAMNSFLTIVVCL